MGRTTGETAAHLHHHHQVHILPLKQFRSVQGQVGWDLEQPALLEFLTKSRGLN